MASPPYYTFEQNSFPGRIARAQEVNTQFVRIQQGFEALGNVPAGDIGEIQFVGSDGKLGASADLTWASSTLNVTGSIVASGGLTAGSLSTAGTLNAGTLTVSGASSLQAIAGTSLTLSAKATSAATVNGDGASVLTTKGWAEDRFAFKSHTHDADDVVSGTLAVARIPNLAANKITSGTFADARIPSLAASKITSGTFANARISAGSVTQHQGSIDHNQLANYSIAQHRVINDSLTSTTNLWSAAKISAELQDIVAGANPPPGDDRQIAFNDDGSFGASPNLTLSAAGHLAIGGKATSAATVNGDPANTLITKGWAETLLDGSEGEYDAAQIVSGTFELGRIPNLPASQTTSGTFNVNRIPNLAASKITSGVLPAERGGTGLSLIEDGVFLRGSSFGVWLPRTSAEVRSDIGAAPVSHNHNASAITAGTLSVTRGGTGVSSWTAGHYVRASGASSLEGRTAAQVRDDINAAPTSHTHSAANITSGTLNINRLPVVSIVKGGTGATAAAGARSNLGIGSMATRDVTISSAAPVGSPPDGTIWLVWQ